MATWVGQPADRLVSEWGPPQSTYPLSTGGAVLQWSSSRTAQIGGFLVPQTTTSTGTVSGYGGTSFYSGQSTTYAPSPVYNLEFSCVIRVTVRPDGLIQSWNSEGNNCVATR